MNRSSGFWVNVLTGFPSLHLLCVAEDSMKPFQDVQLRDKSVRVFESPLS